jgi:hypothetical protein
LTDDAQLPRAAERLIARHVESVGALDLLLLLHAGRDRDWSLDELCTALRCPAPWAEGQLRDFIVIDLAREVADGRYRYERGRQHGAAVDAIARACRHDRAAVTRLVFAWAARRRGQFAV